MIDYVVIYMSIALLAVAALVAMLLRIGALLSDCPVNGPTIRISALSIATGFAAIGVRGVVLIGALVTAVVHAGPLTILSALGLALMCIGLGFVQAVSTLQAVVREIAKTTETTA